MKSLADLTKKFVKCLCPWIIGMFAISFILGKGRAFDNRTIELKFYLKLFVKAYLMFLVGTILSEFIKKFIKK